MGLGGVELVMDVEERFKIRIADAHAERVQTAGDLYFLVLGLVQRFEETGCRSAVVFYRLRAAFVRALHVDRSQVRPNASLAGLLGAERPNVAWRKVEQELEFSLPALHYPAWRSLAYLGLCALVAVVAISLGVWWACGATLVVLPICIALCRSADRLASLPASCRTLRDLVNQTTALRPSDDEVQPAAVWDALRQLIADITGHPRDAVKRETRLVEDLGL